MAQTVLVWSQLQSKRSFLSKISRIWQICLSFGCLPAKTFSASGASPLTLTRGCAFGPPLWAIATRSPRPQPSHSHFSFLSDAYIKDLCKPRGLHRSLAYIVAYSLYRGAKLGPSGNSELAGRKRNRSIECRRREVWASATGARFERRRREV